MARLPAGTEGTRSNFVKDSATGSPIDANTSALRDLATLKAFFTGAVIGPVMDAPWSPIFIIALFLLSPWLGVVGLLGGGALAGLAILNDRLTKGPTLARE